MGYISQFEASDIDSDDIDLRFEVDGVETGTTVSIVDECGHAAQIITALLDELEHYKSREERVTKLVLDNSTSWDALYKKLEAAERRIAELEKGHQEAAKQINSWRRLAKQNIAERGKDISELEAARQRIAELEAKLETADRLHDSAFRDGLKAGFSYGQTDDQSGFTQCMSAYNTTPASLLPDGLIRAVHFYEQVKRENPPVETGAWKDAIDWVLKEACLAASTLESSREHEAISQQEKA
ncbi:ead/Ea22-like family protein [Salmonella enterica]|nr:ead/Ea22-like family protein [Salmonella enterica]